MDIFSTLQKNSDIVLGVGAGVVFGPQILSTIGGMFDLGQYETVITSGAVAAGAIAAFGKKKPALAVSFASVFLAYGLLSVFPQLQA